MKNKKIVITSCLILIGGFIVFSFTMFPGKKTVDIGIAEASTTVYKSPSCGCCDMYISYLKRNGFDVKVENVSDMSLIKNKYNIPAHLQSCHTSVFGERVVEGHIPLEVIGEFLAGESDLGGIALPGMPSGAPGMPGMRTGEFGIYELDKMGEHHLFMNF